MPTTPGPAATTPPATSARRGVRTPRPRPVVRVAYTRHATAGNGDDRIVHPIVVWLAWGGGVALLAGILLGGFQWGRASAPPTSVVLAPVTSPTPAPAVTPPVQSPQVIQPMVVQPVVIQPGVIQAPVTQSQQIVSPQPLALTDAEQRNEALKERLRSRYRIQ